MRISPPTIISIQRICPVEILKRDFANNQIIIASIYEYRLPNINKISIVNRLIE